MHMAEAWQGEGTWGAEVSGAVLTLPQLRSAEGSSVVIADKCLCRAWLSKGVFGTQGGFPRSSLDCPTSNLTVGICRRQRFQLGRYRGNPAPYYSTNINSLLPCMYKEGKGATSFLQCWKQPAPKWSPSAVMAASLTLLLPRRNILLISPMQSEWGWMQRQLIVSCSSVCDYYCLKLCFLAGVPLVATCNIGRILFLCVEGGLD